MSIVYANELKRKTTLCRKGWIRIFLLLLALGASKFMNGGAELGPHIADAVVATLLLVDQELGACGEITFRLSVEHDRDNTKVVNGCSRLQTYVF